MITSSFFSFERDDDMQYETYDFLGGHLTIFYSKKGMTFVSLAEDPVADYQAWFGEMTVKPSQERHYGSVVSDYLAGRRVDFTTDWQGEEQNYSVKFGAL